VPFPAVHLAPPPRRVNEVDMFVEVDEARRVVRVGLEDPPKGVINCLNRRNTTNRQRMDPAKAILRI
jgi:hypothetical protein